MTTPDLAVHVSGRGRMYRHPVTDELYPSITNIIDVLHKPALIPWAAKITAGAAWDRRHALVKITDRDAAVDMLKSEHRRSSGKKADTGTAVHEVCEALSNDSPLPEFGNLEAPFLDGFMEFVTDFDPTFRVIEGTVFNDTYRYAGTFDGLADIGGLSVLFDHKTGSGVYREVALQLSASRYAEWLWDRKTGELQPMPSVDVCVAVHLRPDSYKVRLINADPPAFEAFLGARALWPWANGGGSDGAVGVVLTRERLLRGARVDA